jgi:hypothetical protein
MLFMPIIASRSVNRSKIALPEILGRYLKNYLADIFRAMGRLSKSAARRSPDHSNVKMHFMTRRSLDGAGFVRV